MTLICGHNATTHQTMSESVTSSRLDPQKRRQLGTGSLNLLKTSKQMLRTATANSGFQGLRDLTGFSVEMNKTGEYFCERWAEEIEFSIANYVPKICWDLSRITDRTDQSTSHWTSGECWETSWGQWKILILTLLNPEKKKEEKNHKSWETKQSSERLYSQQGSRQAQQPKGRNKMGYRICKAENWKRTGKNLWRSGTGERKDSCLNWGQHKWRNQSETGARCLHSWLGKLNSLKDHDRDKAV